MFVIRYVDVAGRGEEKGGVTSSLLDSSNRWEEALKAGGSSLRLDMFGFCFPFLKLFWLV